jgi:cysteine desulfurase
MVLGGGQEHGRRSGTHNVAGIVGMAAAASLTAERQAATVERVSKLRDRLADGLVASVPGAVETAVPRYADGPDRSHKIAGNCHLCIDGIESEALLFLLEKHEVYASAASSCSSGAMEVSHVLAAVDVTPSAAGGSLRLSLGPQTTDADVDLALDAVPAAVERLRRFA